MRWQRLFADLEARFQATADAEFDAEVADRVRSETARTALVDRLRAAPGASLRLDVLGQPPLRGTLRSVGPDWLLLAEGTAADGGGSEALVPLSAVCGVGGLPRPVAPALSPSSVGARLRLPTVLRQVARDRSPVTLALRDGSTVAGTLDRVGADFVDVAEHPGGAVRRAAEVAGTRTVPIAVLSCVRRR